MPYRLAKPCAHPGCPELVHTRYCADHQREWRQSQDENRPNSTQRGYGSKWREYREAYLKAHPYCVNLFAHDVQVRATVVDHIKPHRGDMRLFWDKTNHQGLCKSCHDRKTATHESLHHQ